MSRLLVSISIVAATLCAPLAHADDDPDTRMFSFSGFGTVGVVHSSEDNADFTASNFKPDGAGFTDDWSLGVDSLLGAQLTARFTPKLSAVVQVIAMQNYDGSYDPHVEWANIKYQFTPDFSIRVGRTVLPSFLLTESREVGYTYPWVRPPWEVYLILPVTSSDGVDVTYRLHSGDFTNTIYANAGGRDTKSIDGSTTTARHSWGLSYTVQHGALTALITYQTTRLTIPGLNGLFNGFRQFGPQGIAIADRYDSDNKAYPSIAIGASYDPGQWFLMGEWSKSDHHSVLGKLDGWYVSGGYRFGDFTPYLTYAHAGADNLSDPGLTLSTLPPFLRGPAAGLNGALNSILSSKAVQDTVSIGARWDFMDSFDLKLQFDHTNVGRGSTGTFGNTQPAFQRGDSANMFSATIDFVF